MHGVSSKIFIGLLLSGTAFAQSQGPSLGEVARANRQKEQAQEANGTKPKVITNQDMPATTPIPESSPSDPMTTVSGVQRHDPYADQRFSNNNRMRPEQPFGNRMRPEQGYSEQSRSRIQDQENRIAELQARIDRANAATHRAVGTAQYDAPVNRYQAMQSQRMAMMQEMLERQKQRLAMMQDQARRAGMGQ